MKKPTRTRSSMSDERRYRANDALHTITRAEQHKKDPGLMRDVRSLAKQHAAAVMPPRGPGKGDKC